MKNLQNALLLKQLYQLKNLGFNYTNAQVYAENHSTALELPNTLEALKKQAQNCHLCSLSKNRNQVVFGEGKREAKLMFIGDKPLEIDDNAGKPFLGRGGEMLTAMIEKVIGISRDEVYVTNLLKCHPVEENTVPESAFHTCKAYLLKEIELIKPHVIVTLGEEAYHYLTNDTTPLTEIRGSLISKENHTIVPTYHPNFLLKNPSLKKEVFLDLQKVQKLLT